MQQTVNEDYTTFSLNKTFTDLSNYQKQKLLQIASTLDFKNFHILRGKTDQSKNVKVP